MPSESEVKGPYKEFSFINYTISGTQLNTEREVFVANTAYAQGRQDLARELREWLISKRYSFDLAQTVVEQVEMKLDELVGREPK